MSCNEIQFLLITFSKEIQRDKEFSFENVLLTREKTAHIMSTNAELWAFFFVTTRI